MRDKEPKTKADSPVPAKGGFDIASVSAAAKKGAFDMAAVTAAAKASSQATRPRRATKDLGAGVVSVFTGAAKNMKAEGEKLKDKLKESEEKLKELGENLKELPLASSVPCIL